MSEALLLIKAHYFMKFQFSIYFHLLKMKDITFGHSNKYLVFAPNALFSVTTIVTSNVENKKHINPEHSRLRTM